MFFVGQTVVLTANRRSGQFVMSALSQWNISMQYTYRGEWRFLNVKHLWLNEFGRVLTLHTDPKHQKPDAAIDGVELRKQQQKSVVQSPRQVSIWSFWTLNVKSYGDRQLELAL